jgi:hypothetical protein
MSCPITYIGLYDPICYLSVIIRRRTSLLRPPSVALAQSSNTIVCNFFYDWEIGLLCFACVAECSASELHGKTIGILTVVNASINVAGAVGIPCAVN